VAKNFETAASVILRCSSYLHWVPRWQPYGLGSYSFVVFHLCGGYAFWSDYSDSKIPLYPTKDYWIWEDKLTGVLNIGCSLIICN
jgi:hypothetical protein